MVATESCETRTRLGVGGRVRYDEGDLITERGQDGP